MTVEIRYGDGSIEVVPGRVSSCHDGVLVICDSPTNDRVGIVLANVVSWRES